MKPSEARILWIESGAMSGGSRNQIEFDEALAGFFTNELPPLNASVALQLGVNVGWLECGLAHKRTSFGVDIYRLSMPTVARGGHDYPGTVIAFERNGPYPSKYFQLQISESDDPRASEWSRLSSLRDTTAGGRHFGLIP